MVIPPRRDQVNFIKAPRSELIESYVTRQFDNAGMYGLSSLELPQSQEQEAQHQPLGNGKVLQMVQEASGT